MTEVRAGAVDGAVGVVGFADAPGLAVGDPVAVADPVGTADRVGTADPAGAVDPVDPVVTAVTADPAVAGPEAVTGPLDIAPVEGAGPLDTEAEGGAPLVAAPVDSTPAEVGVGAAVGPGDRGPVPMVADEIDRGTVGVPVTVVEQPASTAAAINATDATTADRRPLISTLPAASISAAAAGRSPTGPMPGRTGPMPGPHRPGRPQPLRSDRRPVP